jgi:hypothetical protein
VFFHIHRQCNEDYNTTSSCIYPLMRTSSSSTVFRASYAERSRSSIAHSRFLLRKFLWQNVVLLSHLRNLYISPRAVALLLNIKLVDKICQLCQQTCWYKAPRPQRPPLLLALISALLFCFPTIQGWPRKIVRGKVI